MYSLKYTQHWFLLLGRRNKEDDEEEHDINIMGECLAYFETEYTFFRKVLCILSCCCIFNRDAYYNRKYEHSKLLQINSKLGNSSNEHRTPTMNTKAANIPKWLLKLRQNIYQKRIEFVRGSGNGYKYTGRDYLDIIRLLTLVLCVYILTQFNLSRIYHFIRAQENFKLYMLFKIIMVIEHLLSSLGEDCMEALFISLRNDDVDTGNQRNLRYILLNLFAFVFYNILHSLLLYGHLITLNAAMNSPNNTLITILVADNFYELKTTVFKKYEIENVFQMACSDIVERFVIFLFVLLILLQNLCYLGFDNFDAEQWFTDSFKLFLIMVGFEIIVDTVKHGFVCKFNHLSIDIYNVFHVRLSKDFTNSRRMYTSMIKEDENNDDELSGTEEELDSSFFMDRRLGFPSLPLVTIFLRVMWQISEYNQNSQYDWFVKLTFIGVVFAILYAIKLLLSLILIGKSIKYIKRGDVNELAKPEQSSEITRKLSNVTRYTLIKKIPI